MRGKKEISILGLILGLIFYLILPLYANELSELKEKIQTLQQENRALQDRLKNQETLMQELAGRLDELEQKETGRVITERMPLISLPAIPQMQIKGFGDVSFTAEKADDRSIANPSTFTLGALDLFIISQLSNRVSFLNENTIEFGGTGQSSEIDLERLYLKYNLSDLLNIVIGRFHTALGYWNTTFHHGKWFQLTHSRPLIMEYEHDNGIMPMHSVGIKFSGRKDIGLFDAEYSFAITNGRANSVNRVQNVQDANDNKAFNTLLTLKPHFIDGLKFGFNTYVDKIPAATTPADRTGEINELILGGYFAYQKKNLEVLFEGFQINHDDEASQSEYNTAGLYLQASYKVREEWTPYYRFDLLDFGRGDPYFSNIDIDNKKHTLGLRWDIFAWNALKLEYGYSDRKNASDRHSINLSDSFHF